MRIADRHIEWDAKSVLTWQYDKAVNMIAFLSLWQKWVDLNCSQMFYGCKSRLITKDNASENGYSFTRMFGDESAPDVVTKYSTVSDIKSELIGVSQGWLNTDARNEQSGKIESTGRQVVFHTGDTFKMRIKKLYRVTLDEDGKLVREWVGSEDDESYGKVEEGVTVVSNSVANGVTGVSDDGNPEWYETENEYTYVTWNGEQWVQCPTYNHEYTGGWFADIFAIDTCNEFGLLLWAKLIGVELPVLYGTESGKTSAQTDEQNEIWRTYIKARFYRLLTNGSMNDIITYLHHVFAQFDNHQIIVDDGGSYEIGVVTGDVFTEAYNTITDATGSVTSGYVCSVVRVDPNTIPWDVTDQEHDIFRNSDTLIKVGYRVNVTDVADKDKKSDMTVVETGLDCITAGLEDGGGVKTFRNVIKVQLLGEWQEGYTITKVEDGFIEVENANGEKSSTIKNVAIYDADRKEIQEGYLVVSVNDGGTVTLEGADNSRVTVDQESVRVRFYGDWVEGYTVDEYVSASEIIVVDAEGNKYTTKNSVWIYDELAEDYVKGYKVYSVDHASLIVMNEEKVRQYVENQYIKMVPYLDIEYFGVKLMTIAYSCEFDQNVIERAILNISDFLPHPSAVLSENTMFAGDDIPFGFNTHNFIEACLPTVVKGTDNKNYYVFPYQDVEESDCDIPKKLRILRPRNTELSYIADKSDTTQVYRGSGDIGRWDNIFVCHMVGSNGSGVTGAKGAAYWAVGTEWDCHVEDSEETDVETVSKFVGQTTLYKYDSEGMVVTGFVMTPIIYTESNIVDGVKANGYIRKIDSERKKWYDGQYDPTNIDSTKWKDLSKRTETYEDGRTEEIYYYEYTPIGADEPEQYDIEFDIDGEAKYINYELRCYANYEEAQNAVRRIESYNTESEITPLAIATNQNIGNLQTVSYAGDFFTRYLMFVTEKLFNVPWKEFNLFGRKSIDPNNGGYFKGGLEGTPVGLTEIVRVFLKGSGSEKDTIPRSFELWHKNYIQRLDVMMDDESGTLEFHGIKISYTRTDRNRRNVANPVYEGKHPVNELFKFENGEDYDLAPPSGTYIVDFLYEPYEYKYNYQYGLGEEDVEERTVKDYVFKGIRFKSKLKVGESDEDLSLSWTDRLNKYDSLYLSDVMVGGDTQRKVSSYVMMPTCDYGFMKYRFKTNSDGSIQEELDIPNAEYYYGYGDYGPGSDEDTYGGKPIPSSEGSVEDEPYEKELAIIELWGQNQLETLDHGNLASRA